MKKIGKILTLSAVALLLLGTSSLATSRSYSSNILLFNAHKTFASGSKSSGTNNRGYNVLYSSTPRSMRMWIDGHTGSWRQITSSNDFAPGRSRTWTYYSTPRAGSSMRLRGRSVSASGGGQRANGYVNFY